MPWELVVIASGGLVALGLMARLVTGNSTRRVLAGAVAISGIALLFAAQAYGRADAGGLVVGWIMMGAWLVSLLPILVDEPMRVAGDELASEEQKAL